MSLLLWVGLGNPGPEYARNRHNIGFMAVDAIAARHGFAPWRNRFRGLVADGMVAGRKVLALKPQTFMNLSGQSVGEAMRYLKLSAAEVTVFHDELDLAPGRLRLKQGGGHAGHNGLRSLHAHLGEGYGRVRLGIGHPGHRDRVTGHVLSDFARADADWLDELLAGISHGAPALAAGDGARFLAAVAARLSPPEAGSGGTQVGAAAGPRAPPTAPRTATPAPDPAPPDGTGGAPGLLRRLAERFR